MQHTQQSWFGATGASASLPWERCSTQPCRKLSFLLAFLSQQNLEEGMEEPCGTSLLFLLSLVEKSVKLKKGSLCFLLDDGKWSSSLLAYLKCHSTPERNSAGTLIAVITDICFYCWVMYLTNFMETIMDLAHRMKLSGKSNWISLEAGDSQKYCFLLISKIKVLAQKQPLHHRVLDVHLLLLWEYDLSDLADFHLEGNVVWVRSQCQNTQTVAGGSSRKPVVPGRHHL